MCIRDRYEIGWQLLLITNRKSHTGFRLVPTSMTLNDLERRNSLYFAFFPPNSTDFWADYITVVEDRPIMSVKYCLRVTVFYFWRKLWHTLQRGLSAIAEHLVSATESIGVSSTTFTQCAQEATEFGEITQTWGLLRRSRSFKVTEFGTNR